MTGDPIIVGLGPHLPSTAIALLLARSTACGPAYYFDDRPPVDPMAAFKAFEDLTKLETRFLIDASSPDYWTLDSDPDESPLRRKQRLFREFVQTTRRPEQRWLPPGMVKQGKRVVTRWGRKSREQRDRRQL